MTEEKIEVAQEEVPEEQQVAEAQKEQPKDADHNWQEANRVLKLQQQKIAELEMRLNQPLPQAQPVVEEKDEFADLAPDDYLTVDKARRMAEKMAEKKGKEAARQMIQEYAQQQQVQQDEVRARTKYEDYDYVVENYAIPLIKNDPALAHKIQHSKNPAETAYKLGKLSDSYEESAAKQVTSPKADKIIKNSQRPVSANALGNPLKTQADQFAKLSKEEVWAQSQQFARGA